MRLARQNRLKGRGCAKFNPVLQSFVFGAEPSEWLQSAEIERTVARPVTIGVANLFFLASAAPANQFN
ncbi:MAG: hypothetical protein ACTHOI_09635 [Sphingomicrobium sp.]